MNSDSETTTTLLEHLKGGASDFDELFLRHRDRLKAAIALRVDRQLKARVDASDIVQDAQAEAYRRLPDYLDRTPMPFHLWLRKMAQERLIMARRQHLGAERRAVSRELPLPAGSTAAFARQMFAQGKSPSQAATDAELAERVQTGLAQLSESNREVLMMRVYEGLSYDDIAAVLGISAAAARQRNGRALIQLHQFLAAEGISESRL